MASASTHAKRTTSHSGRTTRVVGGCGTSRQTLLFKQGDVTLLCDWRLGQTAFGKRAFFRSFGQESLVMGYSFVTLPVIHARVTTSWKPR